MSGDDKIGCLLVLIVGVGVPVALGAVIGLVFGVASRLASWIGG